MNSEKIEIEFMFLSIHVADPTLLGEGFDDDDSVFFWFWEDELRSLEFCFPLLVREG